MGRGLIAEIVVLGCIVAGICANSAVVGTCDMLVLGSGKGHVGPWRADVDGSGCQGWEKSEAEEADWLINMARACSMMALVFGIALFIFAFFSQCLCPLPCSQGILDLSGIGVQIGLSLTWPIFRSSVCNTYGCSWGGGATSLLLSQIFYLLASVFTRCMREPRYKRAQERREDDNEPPKVAVQNDQPGP